MKPAFPAILICTVCFWICGCASPVALPLQMKTLSLASQPQVAIEWPTMTLRVGFRGLDLVASTYANDWTNYWSCDVLASMDITKPRDQWDRYPNYPLAYFGGELGFEFTTNAPWCFLMTEYTPKP